MRTITRYWTGLAGGLLAAAGAAGAFAQATAPGAGTYPDKTVRFLVGFAPGGSTDIVARLIAQELGKNLGQQVLVDNRTGAGGIVATEALVRSPPDGYTIFACTTGTFAIQPFMFSKLPYNVEKDIVPVTQTGSLPYIIVVHPSLPVKTLKDVVDFYIGGGNSNPYRDKLIKPLTHLTGQERADLVAFLESLTGESK